MIGGRSGIIASSRRGASLDPDATTLIAAIEASLGSSLSGPTKTAIDTFFVSLKSALIYSKIAVMWGFVGGTSGTHAIQWKSPGTSDMTFPNGATHDADGVTFDGVNQYGNSNYAYSTSPLNGLAFGVYNRTTGGQNGYDFGIESGGANSWLSVMLNSAGSQVEFYTAAGGFTGGVTTDGLGLTVGVVDSSDVLAYRNASVENSTASTVPFSVSTTLNSYIGCLNSGGVAAYFANRNYSFSFISEDEWDATEMTDLYDAVQDLQVSLGRDV